MNFGPHAKRNVCHAKAGYLPSIWAFFLVAAASCDPKCGPNMPKVISLRKRKEPKEKALFVVFLIYPCLLLFPKPKKNLNLNYDMIDTFSYHSLSF